MMRNNNLMTFLFLILFSFHSAQSSTILDNLTAKDVTKTYVKLFSLNKYANFELSSKDLNKGAVMGFNGYAVTRTMKKNYPNLYAIVEQMKNLYSTKKSGYTGMVKLAYIVPKAKSKDFTPQLTSTEEYIEKTMYDTIYHDPKEGKYNLRITKLLIPKVKNVTTESAMEYSYVEEDQGEDIPLISQELLDKISLIDPDLGPADRITIGKLIYTNSSNYTDSIILTQYYNLPDGSGTFIVYRILASINMNSTLAYFVNSRLGRSIRRKTFIKETNYSIRGMRKIMNK